MQKQTKRCRQQQEQHLLKASTPKQHKSATQKASYQISTEMRAVFSAP